MEPVGKAPEAKPADREPRPPVSLGGLDPDSLQTLLDSLAGMLGTAVVVRDPAGRMLTRPALPAPFFKLLAGGGDVDVVRLLAEHGTAEHTAPIVVDGRPAAVLAVSERLGAPPEPATVAALARAAGTDAAALSGAAAALPRWSPEQRDAAVAFLAVLTAGLSRLERSRLELSRRDARLKTLVQISDLAASGRNLTSILNSIARSATDLMGGKACMIRLLDESGTELVARAVHKLSWQYVAKGPLRLADSAVDRAALRGEIVEVPDLGADERTLYKEAAQREGLVSNIVVGMIHAGEPVGVVRVYAGSPRAWTRQEKDLLRSTADQAALAIVNARLFEGVRRIERLDREMALGRQVQRRMLPAEPPAPAGFQIGTVYEPSSQIAGDFYDFIAIDGQNVGLVIGDVVGKGVPAALWMASVRAALRANVEHEYDIVKIMSQVNRALCRDTLKDEFATLLYGVLDVSGRRFTYCNAGHEPPVLIRDGREHPLTSSSPLLGVIPEAAFEKAVIDLLPGDVLTMWTDGTTDAMNFFDEPFGRERVLKAVHAKAKESAEAIARHVLWETRRFAGLNSRMDDITILVVKAV
jgi:sigma-B regulation protein RsbU (phosphoserine phosphatase)